MLTFTVSNTGALVNVMSVKLIELAVIVFKVEWLTSIDFTDALETVNPVNSPVKVHVASPLALFFNLKVFVAPAPNGLGSVVPPDTLKSSFAPETEIETSPEFRGTVIVTVLVCAVIHPIDVNNANRTKSNRCFIIK